MKNGITYTRPLYGKCVGRSKQPDVDQKHTHQQLRNSVLKTEPDGFISSAQGQSLLTIKPR